VHCHYFESQQCRSCQWLDSPYEQQLAKKETTLAQLLSSYSPPLFLRSVSSPQSSFRNKAKMVVLGNTDRPLLGILTPKGKPISLCDCPLYPEDMQLLLHKLEAWLSTLHIAPYDVKRRSGELKYLLLNRNEQGVYMLRLVVRSTDAIPTIKNALPILLANQPLIQTVSVNIQALHAAILEGPEEHILHGEHFLCQTLNGIPLYQRPKGFFQTNPLIAAQLYAAAASWLADLEINVIWDLFCGSGGFGLHCITAERSLIGIEIEPEAIACASRSAQELGIASRVSFRALDSANFTEHRGDSASTVNLTASPDVVIVNPPRRGLGQALCQDLANINAPYILYSSCNPQSLAKDLAELEQYRIHQVQIFDMFPNTAHYEVLVLLVNSNNAP
jgi:23S rRNA (uracil747-C5)-methyltransferase